MSASTLTEAAVDCDFAPAAANDNPADFVTVLEDQPVEGGFDPVFGDVTWQTLISGDKTASNGWVQGVATFPANGVLHLHRHAPPEFYLCLEGSGFVMMDGQPLHISAGSAVFILANAAKGCFATKFQFAHASLFLTASHTCNRRWSLRNSTYLPDLPMHRGIPVSS